MIYAVHALFKPDIEARRDALHEAFNDHLAQPLRRIRLAGTLRGEDGVRKGVFMLLEADNPEQVKHFTDSSPYAELYDTVVIHQIDLQIGHLT